MRYLSVALVLLAGLLWSPSATAQQSAPVPASTHTRARDGAETTLALENARLYVPAGAVTPGEVVAFGTGGVPDADGSLLRSGVVVSAAGGLHAPIAVLIAPSQLDRAALGSGTPALRSAADGVSHACAPSGSWIVCPVPDAGAYVLDATDGPPSTDPLVRVRHRTIVDGDSHPHHCRRGRWWRCDCVAAEPSAHRKARAGRADVNNER
jgi:hypothetical protein